MAVPTVATRRDGIDYPVKFDTRGRVVDTGTPWLLREDSLRWLRRDGRHRVRRCKIRLLGIGIIIDKGTPPVLVIKEILACLAGYIREVPGLVSSWQPDIPVMNAVNPPLGYQAVELFEHANVVSISITAERVSGARVDKFPDVLCGVG